MVVDSVLLRQHGPTLYARDVGYDRSFDCAGDMDHGDLVVPEEGREGAGRARCNRDIGQRSGGGRRPEVRLIKLWGDGRPNYNRIA